MRVLILGIDGYLGWPLALHLKERGHELMGVDNGSRRRRVRECGGDSAFELSLVWERAVVLGCTIEKLSLPSERLDCLIGQFKPEAIVYLAEQPSAPYSMIGVEQCLETIHGNVMGTAACLWSMHKHVPDCHLLHLGSMGTYGTPNVDIPEGWFDLELRGRTTRALFPRSGGSLYHITKCCDALFVEFACRVWGLRSTDVMQGVVYGTRTPEMGDPIEPRLRTRFDFDGVFGTAINRYCAQAVLGLPITPYGAGGQTRGFLPLKDSIQCMRLAIENPPERGEYRVVNQLEECRSVKDLAGIVAECAVDVGIASPEVAHIDNPRKEAEEHYYNPDHDILLQLGYEPTGDLRGTIREMLVDLSGVSGRLSKYAGAITPTVRW